MKKLKIFLDDTREAPDGFLPFKKARGLKRFITEVLEGDLGQVSVISLDHDLGRGEPTGADFLKWVVEGILDGRIRNARSPKWEVHSANPVGASNMKALIGDLLRASYRREIEELARLLNLDERFLIYLVREWVKDLRKEGTSLREPEDLHDVLRVPRLAAMLRGYLSSLVDNEVHHYATGKELKDLLRDQRKRTGKFSSGKALSSYLSYWEEDYGYDEVDKDWGINYH